jgi:hypothetical protein
MGGRMGISRRARSAVPVALAGVLALSGAGCGSGGAGHTTSSSQAKTSAPALKQVPTSSATGTTDPAAAAPSPQRSTEIVNTVCATVRQGAPRPLAAPFTRAKVARYVNGARPVLRRVQVSLQRISRQPPSAPGLGKLVRAVAHLRAAYVAAPGLLQTGNTTADGARHAAQAIAQTEALVSATARDAGFPACAIA